MSYTGQEGRESILHYLPDPWEEMLKLLHYLPDPWEEMLKLLHYLPDPWEEMLKRGMQRLIMLIRLKKYIFLLF